MRFFIPSGFVAHRLLLGGVYCCPLNSSVKLPISDQLIRVRSAARNRFPPRIGVSPLSSGPVMRRWVPSASSVQVNVPCSVLSRRGVKSCLYFAFSLFFEYHSKKSCVDGKRRPPSAAVFAKQTVAIALD